VEKEAANKRPPGGYLEALLHSCPDCILAIDVEGNITFANRAATSLLEFEMKDLVGRNVTTLYETEEKARETNFELYESGGVIHHHQSTVRTKSGKVVPVRISAAHLMDNSGTVTGSVGYFEVYHPWKEEEQRLHAQLAKLEEEIVRSNIFGATIRKLFDGVSLSSMAGKVDVGTVERMKNSLVEHAGTTGTRAFVLDLSSAVMEGPDVVKAFIKLVRTVRLIGPGCFVAGLSPELAAEMEPLIATAGDLRTFVTLEQALQAALAAVGFTIRELGT